jgi:hypothetical protein
MDSGLAARTTCMLPLQRPLVLTEVAVLDVELEAGPGGRPDSAV